MNINQLYEFIIDEISENISGSFELFENTIIWTYTDNEVYEQDLNDDIDYIYYDDNDDDLSSINNEEKLNEIYFEDKEIIEIFLDSINEFNNFCILESEINNNNISFKII